MRLPSLLVVAASAVAVLVAGCTTEVAGTPSAPTGLLLPPRPREVRLDGVDPCSLLTPEQRVGLGLTSEPQLSSSYVQLFRGDVPTCAFSGPHPEGVLVGISTVTSIGIERWEEHDVAAELQPTTVAGFPAVIAKPKQFTDYCSVEVDVAAGQLLDVQYGSGGSESSIRQNELCQRASQSAAEALETLLAR